MADERRQKIQEALAFETAPEGEAPRTVTGGNEASAAGSEDESPASTERLMEEIVEAENLKKALKRVMANKGCAGADKMGYRELPGYLKGHWPRIREGLLTGRYRPQPVLRVRIPKPDSGMRDLGIPTVLDRFIQQALLQRLQALWDSTFSNSSYGFRPNRSAHQAVARAQEYIQD